MDILSRRTLAELAAPQEGPCVSIYMPLQVSGIHAHDNARRLLSILTDVEQRLSTIGLSPKGRTQFLAIARTFADEQLLLPHHRGEGLALFLSPVASHVYMLPSTTKDIMVIGERFHVAPLLPFVQCDRHFFILALSRTVTRLLQVSEGAVHIVDVPDMPQAAPAESDDVTFVRSIAEAVMPAIVDQCCPLIIAASKPLAAPFKKACAYPHILRDILEGDPTECSPDELMQASLPHARRAMDAVKNKKMKLYHAAAADGRTSTDFLAILDAAGAGTVDCLLIADGAVQWGIIDATSKTIALTDVQELHSEDLLGYAAAQVLARNGDIVVLREEQMPAHAKMAAVLRS